MENTFILFKSDNEENNKIIMDDISERLEKQNLSITQTSKIVLTRNKIMGLWEAVLKDSLLRELFFLNFQNKIVNLLLITGDNAINSIVEIKKEIRKKYSLNAIENCIHTPNSKREYLHDYAVLFFDNSIDKAAALYESNQEVVVSATSVQKLLTQRLEKRYIDATKQYSLYLINDDEHSIPEIANMLHLHVPNIEITDSYAVTIYMGHKYDMIGIFSSNRKKDLFKIKHALKIKGIETTVIRNYGSGLRYQQDGEVAEFFSSNGYLDIWVYKYLKTDANASNIAIEIFNRGGYLIGPILMSLDVFCRKCGPEDNMVYVEDEALFESRVKCLMDKVIAGNDLPPLLVKYEANELDLYDGAHRYEAYKRLGYRKCNLVIWCPTMDVQTALDYFQLKNIGVFTTINKSKIKRGCF